MGEYERDVCVHVGNVGHQKCKANNDLLVNSHAAKIRELETLGQIYAGPKEFSRQLVDGRDVIGPNVHVVNWVPDFFTRHLGFAVGSANYLSKEFQLQGFGFEVSPDVRFEKPAGEGALDWPQLLTVATGQPD